MNARAVLAIALLTTACGRVTNTSSGFALVGSRAAVLSRLTFDGEGGVDVLTLAPPGGRGSSFGGLEWDWSSASTTVGDEGPPRRSLRFTYRPNPERLEIGSENWKLRVGNVFLVRVDEQWRPTVQQLPLQMKYETPREVLQAVQRLLPADKEIASLRLNE